MCSPSGRGPIRSRLRTALTQAMKTGDAAAVSALRSALGAIDNAEAIDPSQAPRPPGRPIAGAVGGLGAGEMARRELSEREMADIVRAEVASRQAAAAEYERLGRDDVAGRLRAEAAVIRGQLELE